MASACGQQLSPTAAARGPAHQDLLSGWAFTATGLLPQGPSVSCQQADLPPAYLIASVPPPATAAVAWPRNFKTKFTQGRDALLMLPSSFLTVMASLRFWARSQGGTLRPGLELTFKTQTLLIPSETALSRATSPAWQPPNQPRPPSKASEALARRLGSSFLHCHGGSVL